MMIKIIKNRLVHFIALKKMGRGFTLIEASIYLLLLAGVVNLALEITKMVTNSLQSQNYVEKIEHYNNALTRYVHDNRLSLMQMSLGQTKQIDATTLITQGYLPASFNAKTIEQQTITAYIRKTDVMKPDPKTIQTRPQLEILTLTSGGKPIPKLILGQAINLIGFTAGEFINNVIQGNKGSWLINDPSSWPGVPLAKGHLFLLTTDNQTITQHQTVAIPQVNHITPVLYSANQVQKSQTVWSPLYTTDTIMLTINSNNSAYVQMNLSFDGQTIVSSHNETAQEVMIYPHQDWLGKTLYLSFTPYDSQGRAGTTLSLAPITVEAFKRQFWQSFNITGSINIYSPDLNTRYQQCAVADQQPPAAPTDAVAELTGIAFTPLAGAPINAQYLSPMSTTVYSGAQQWFTLTIIVPQPINVTLPLYSQAKGKLPIVPYASINLYQDPGVMTSCTATQAGSLELSDRFPDQSSQPIGQLVWNDPLQGTSQNTNFNIQYQ